MKFSLLNLKGKMNNFNKEEPLEEVNTKLHKDMKQLSHK